MDIVKDDIVKRIYGIDNTIEALLKEKAELTEKLLTLSDSFEEKFRIWIKSDKKNEKPYLIREEEYPFTYAWYRKRGMDRHKTYDVCYDLIHDLDFILRPEWYENFISNYPPAKMTDEYKKEIRNVAQEIMDNNLGTFICDW